LQEVNIQPQGRRKKARVGEVSQLTNCETAAFNTGKTPRVESKKKATTAGVGSKVIPGPHEFFPKKKARRKIPAMRHYTLSAGRRGEG